MQSEIIVLRIVHVLGAIVWAGTSLFLGLFLMPALATVGPTGGAVVGALAKRRLFTIVPTVAALTMLAGLRLLWLSSTGFSAAYFATRSGQAFLVGAVCALAAFLIFMLVSHPAIKRAMELGPRLAQAPEAERGALAAELNAVRSRSAKASMVSMLLLIVAAITMAVGRYV